MATVKVRRQIHQLIRFTALSMSLLGLLVTIAPFKIQHHNGQVKIDASMYYRKEMEKYCRLNIRKTYDQYWSGVVTMLTSAITLITYYAKYPQWPPRYLFLPNQKAHCAVAVLITMTSGLAVMSQQEEPFGKQRASDGCKGYYFPKETSDMLTYRKYRYHQSKILSWFYVLLISSNILVVLCTLQFMAFLSIWILNLIEGTDPEENNPQPVNELQQPLLTTETSHEVEPYLNRPTNYNHSCNCMGMRAHMTAERPNEPPPAYTVAHQPNINDVNPCANIPQMSHDHMAPVPTN